MGVDITGRRPLNNAGEYFQTSWWCWRPMYAIINEVSTEYNIYVDTSLYSSNDGAGLDNDEDCQVLAHSIEKWLAKNACELDDRIYLSLGLWRKANGLEQIEADSQNGLLRYNGEILMTGLVGPDGDLIYPLHSIDVPQVLQFVEFLKNCGGFEIW